MKKSMIKVRKEYIGIKLFLLLLIFSGNIYAQNQYGQLWTSHQNARLGYIGNNYQRIYIHFSSVVKSKSSDSAYDVTGKSMSNGNINDFQGTIKVLSVKEQKTPGKLTRKEKERTIYPRYVIRATYCLNEDKSQKGSGIFKGTLTTGFYQKNGKLYYDDQDKLYSDSFRNNQFDGSWQSYDSRAIKPCCWGDYRIPNCGDLDVGEGNFCPNSKYEKNPKLGWDYIQKAQHGDKKAISKESRKWW